MGDPPGVARPNAPPDTARPSVTACQVSPSDPASPPEERAFPWDTARLPPDTASEAPPNTARGAPPDTARPPPDTSSPGTATPDTVWRLVGDARGDASAGAAGVDGRRRKGDPAVEGLGLRVWSLELGV